MTREWKISHLLSKVGEALVSEVKEGWLLMLLTSCLRLLLLLTQQQEAVVGKAAQRRRRWTATHNNSRRRRVLVLRSGLEEAMLAATRTTAASTALPMRSFNVARSGRRGRRRGSSRRFAAEIFGFRFFHLGGFGALPLFGKEELQLAARRRLLEKTLVGWLGPIHNNTQL